jgi:hypothetical protein
MQAHELTDEQAARLLPLIAQFQSACRRRSALRSEIRMIVREELQRNSHDREHRPDLAVE